MKLLFFTSVLSLLPMGGFANKKLATTETELENLIKVNQPETPDAVECSLTASGTVTASNGTVIHTTLTVTGPCDSSLAYKMIDAIEKLREDVSQM